MPLGGLWHGQLRACVLTQLSETQAAVSPYWCMSVGLGLLSLSTSVPVLWARYVLLMVM